MKYSNNQIVGGQCKTLMNIDIEIKQLGLLLVQPALHFAVLPSIFFPFKKRRQMMHIFLFY